MVDKEEQLGLVCLFLLKMFKYYPLKLKQKQVRVESLKGQFDYLTYSPFAEMTVSTRVFRYRGLFTWRVLTGHVIEALLYPNADVHVSMWNVECRAWFSRLPAWSHVTCRRGQTDQ